VPFDGSIDDPKLGSGPSKLWCVRRIDGFVGERSSASNFRVSHASRAAAAPAASLAGVPDAHHNAPSERVFIDQGPAKCRLAIELQTRARTTSVHNTC